MLNGKSMNDPSTSEEIEVNLDFEELLEAFNEMHEEAQRLVALNKRLKSELKLHVKKLASTQDELNKLKQENEKLVSRCKATACDDTSTSINMGDYKFLQTKFENFKKDHHAECMKLVEEGEGEEKEDVRRVKLREHGERLSDLEISPRTFEDRRIGLRWGANLARAVYVEEELGYKTFYDTLCTKRPGHRIPEQPHAYLGKRALEAEKGTPSPAAAEEETTPAQTLQPSPPFAPAPEETQPLPLDLNENQPQEEQDV
ncbi:hypothetical protein JHK85_010580 [Glycine max]|nr:hypothetical protein JHK85_010580 [Glycine max]KAG5066566.1 hypothetical protein JHK86_010297 [Glycine max]